MVYVLASAPPGGDGSEASPLSTITEALGLSSPGTILAIGKGEYDEALRLSPGVTLWGACARETRLTASTWGLLARGVITVSGADARVANLWVGPAELPGVAVYGDSASLSVDGVVIDDTRTQGLWILRGARVDGREVVVSGTRADDAGGFGRGIAVDSAGTLDLRRAWISQNHDVGVFADDEGTSLTLSDVVVRDTRPRQSDDSGGRGVNVQEGATATVMRTLLVRNHELGVYASDDRTSVTISDVVIRDTRAQPSDGTGGRALTVQRGATATVIRTLLSRNREVGVYGSGEGSSLTLLDVVIRDTQPQESDGTAGRALNVERGATTAVTRALLSRNHDLGVYSSGAGTTLTLSDLAIRDTQPQESDGTEGRALTAEEGATATITRALLFGNHNAGMVADGDGTSLTLLDVVIRDTRAQENNGTEGRGLSVQRGATATVTRTLLSRNRDLGVYSSGEGTTLTLSDVVIRDTQAQASDGTGGRGLGVQKGATATVVRALLSQNRELGVFAHSAGTTVELRDVTVAQVDEPACADTTCAAGSVGMGLVGTSEATLSATRFAVQGGALCGVMVANDGQVDLAVGKVSGCQIGVCLQVDGYSVPRLIDRVRYLDNGTNLDATSLPVPEPASAIEAAP